MWVPHSHYLIASKNRFLHISSTRKLWEREKTYFSFFFCQLCLKPCNTLSNYWAAFILFPASQRVSYIDVRALRAATGLTAPAQPLLGPRAPFQPSLGPSVPAPVMLKQCWLYVGTPRLYVTALSLVLSPAPSPLGPDGSPWVVPGPGSLLSISGAVDGSCYRRFLWPRWDGTHQLRAWPVLGSPSGPSSSLFGNSCFSPRSSGNQLWQYKRGKMTVTNHVHLVVFLRASGKHHYWLCAKRPENNSYSLGSCALRWLCTRARGKGWSSKSKMFPLQSHLCSPWPVVALWLAQPSCQTSLGQPGSPRGSHFLCPFTPSPLNSLQLIPSFLRMLKNNSNAQLWSRYVMRHDVPPAQGIARWMLGGWGEACEGWSYLHMK